MIRFNYDYLLFRITPLGACVCFEYYLKTAPSTGDFKFIEFVTESF